MGLTQAKLQTVLRMIPLFLFLVSGCAKSPLIIKGADMENHLHALAGNWPVSRIPLDIDVAALVEKEFVLSDPWLDGFRNERFFVDHKEAIIAAQNAVNAHLSRISDESVNVTVNTVQSFYALGRNSNFTSEHTITILGVLIVCNGQMKFSNTSRMTLKSSSSELGRWSYGKVYRDAMISEIAVAVIGALENIYTACE